MRAFPDADPGTPDLRGPWRYLLWLAAGHWRSFLAACLFNVIWMAALGITPGVIGEAVNAGLVARSQAALDWWGGATFALGVIQAVTAALQDTLVLRAQVGSGYRTLQLVTRHVCDLGATVSRRISTGDLVTVGVSDINLIGQAMVTAARGAGGIVAFVFVAVLMLMVSWPVGLLVLIGVPLILLVTTRLSRLLRKRQDQQRGRQRELTDDAVDIVRGLGVLRGFGGEEMFGRRYRDRSQALRFAALRQAGASALLGAASTFLPGLLLVGVVALAANLVLARQLSVGEMVAFYGYATFLTMPVNRMTNAVSRAAQAHVAAEHITRLLRLEPDIGPGPDSALEPEGLAGPGELADPDSGLTVPPDQLTAVVCTAGDAALLADRLGRYADSGATYGGHSLASFPLAGVRERILVATGDAHLFAGPLRRELDPVGRGRPEGDGPDDDAALCEAALRESVDAASARDIIDALPGGLDTIVAADGREFSGGQQQRLRLVRALMADPEVLILIDPASAVDAHTESKMATGIARLRRGRTTLVFTTSVLLLGHADRVALVIDGKVAAEGTHESLMADEQYRSLVERGMAAA